MPRSDVTGPRFRLLRYGAVGAGVNGAGYLAYLLVTSSGLSPRLTVTVLLPVTLWAAFRLHGRVTFASTDRGSASGVRFLAISLAGYTLNLALLTVLVDAAGLPHQIAQLFSLGLIALVMFHMLRRFVFFAD